MWRRLGGYTVIEVMIFLAISGVIFVTAVLAFQGQQGKTSFEQGMRDLASQLQKYVSEVGTSVLPGADKYACSISISTGRTQLAAGGAGIGSNQACIFLGRAIQVIPTQSKLFAYSVLGNQYDANGETVTSFTSALPEPAFAAGTDLTDEYNTPWGTVSSSKITKLDGTTADSDLVGFYNSLQDGYQNSGVAGAQSIFAKGYNFVSNVLASTRSDAIKTCIEEQNANGINCTDAPIIKSWNVCFASTGSSQTAILSVVSTPAGITTDVNFTSCS